MIPPSLDFTSELFDPYKALHSNQVPLPYPKAKTYNNIADYYSHTFLKKRFESNELSKKQEKPRERNYEWYYDTLGLSEYQRNHIRSTKKKKKRKGKKPVSVVTIPGSPLRSEKVTVCKSDFKDYCRRKYRLLNTTSAIIDIKSKESDDFPSNSTSESSFIPSVIKTKPPDSASVSPFVKRETEEFLPTSSNSTETEYPSSLFRIIKSKPPVSPNALHVIKTELPSTSCVVKTELYDSSDDSCSDDILILKMKSNLLKGCTLKNVYKSPLSFQRKPLKLSSKSKYGRIDPKCMNDPLQITNDLKLSKFSKLGHLNSSYNHSLNVTSNMKSSRALNDSEIASSSQVKDSSSASVNNQKRDSKKWDDGELEVQGDHKTPKHNKKQIHDKNKDNSNILDCDQSRKSATQNIPCQNKGVAYKENSSVNDTKSNMKPIKKRKKSALKSQENMLDYKKSFTAVKVISKSNNIISKIKTENSPVANHCTCNFPCGLSHLCNCGYYANAKEALRKFKIPRKKK